MVHIKKHAFGHNIPFKNTDLTHNHTIYYNGQWLQVKNLINKKTVTLVKRVGIPVYNILCNKHYAMNANGLIVETLDPKNGFARSYFTNPDKKEDNAISQVIEQIITDIGNENGNNDYDNEYEANSNENSQIISSVNVNEEYYDNNEEYYDNNENI